MLAVAAVAGYKLPFLAWSGILSGWFIALALMVTPLMLVFGPLPWLRRRRRYLGVAGFGYGLLHLGFWLAHASIGSFLRSFIRPEVVTGWIALAIFVPLAWTSTDRAVRRLGPRWKVLQRWVYPAAVLTYVHWLMTTENMPLAIASGLPLMLLTVWRLLRRRNRSGAA